MSATSQAPTARFISAADAIRRHPSLNRTVLYRLAALRKVDVDLGRGENIKYSASDLARVLAPSGDGSAA